MNTFHTPASGVSPGMPVRIDPDAWYDDAALRLLINVTGHTLRAARRLGRLRFTRRGFAAWHRGSWVNAWLEGGAE